MTKLTTVFRSIRGRLGLLIVLAMVALVGYLVYDGLQERRDEEERAQENLQRLAVLAASAERTRFDATENFLNIVKQAEAFVNVATTPGDQEAYEACTRGLFISDSFVPGTRFSLWDTNGDILCSSRGARPGDYSAAGHLWFEQTKERQGFAAGNFERLDDTEIPILSFGIPITRPGTQEVVAYVSGAVMIDESELLPSTEGLPETGRLTIFDQDGTVIASTGREPGYQLQLFPASFAGLGGYLAGATEGGNGRTGAAVRITDQDDALVGVIVSADNDALVSPIAETLLDLMLPIAILTFITLVAVWLLGQRWIVQPIESLGRMSDALASGDLEARSDVRSGVSEIDNLATKFNEMAETRERSSRAKDEFLGLVSHELKTPITTVLGNAAILRNRGERLTPETRQAAIEDIYDGSQRLATIVDNLLVLARLERGVGLESEPLSLVRLSEGAAEHQLRRTPSRRVVVQGDAEVLALGGETYVQQILQNLIANGVKYSPRDEAVDVVVERRGEMAVVRVLDRGLGIDAAEVEAVFQPFYRSPRTADSAEGVGIGLSVCRRLVEAMGGEIWVVPRDGGGTEFGFSLPGVRADEAVLADDELDTPSLKAQPSPAG